MTDLIKSEEAASVLAWLKNFAERIASIDYAGARELFSPAVFGFGTAAKAYHSLEEWHQSQWRRVWPRTKGFQFELATLQTLLSADQSLCCIACEWQNDGKRDDGSTFTRRGRTTILLAADASKNGRWVGVHCHFSIAPHSAI